MFNKKKDVFEEQLEKEEQRILSEMQKANLGSDIYLKLMKELAELNDIRINRFESKNKESKIVKRIDTFGTLGLKLFELSMTVALSISERKHKTKMFYEEERVLKEFAQWEETNMFSTTPGKILGGNMCKKFGK